MASPLRPTTLIEAPRLSAVLGIDVLFASEAFQHTGSFKFRAAYHVVSNTPHRDYLTASSGNFGQALARACQLLGRRCTVVMPSTSALVKIDAVRAYGGSVELIDVAVTSRSQRLEELALRNPAAYVASPYDDDLVIEGNATLGAELAALDRAIVLPVGGGGLAAGVLTGLRRCRAMLPVFGAEPSLANDAARSLGAGLIVANETEPQTLADGARTLALGTRNFAVLRAEIAGIVEVPEALIAEAVRLLSALANVKAEPTGALALAALLAEPERFRGQRVCCVVSGGNVDPALYCRLLSGAMS